VRAFEKTGGKNISRRLAMSSPTRALQEFVSFLPRCTFFRGRLLTRGSGLHGGYHALLWPPDGGQFDLLRELPPRETHDPICVSVGLSLNRLSQNGKSPVELRHTIGRERNCHSSFSSRKSLIATTSRCAMIRDRTPSPSGCILSPTKHCGWSIVPPPEDLVS
jgi:hypothetical protein